LREVAGKRRAAEVGTDLLCTGTIDVSDRPGGVLERLRHCFLSYKQRPDDRSRIVRVAEIYDRDEALEVIGRSRADYHEPFGEAHDRLAELQELLAAGVKSDV
jgi:inorganic pyrophosphatase